MNSSREKEFMKEEKMNRMKKFMAMLLAVVLVAQSGFTSAAEETVSAIPSAIDVSADAPDAEQPAEDVSEPAGEVSEPAEESGQASETETTGTDGTVEEGPAEEDGTEDGTKEEIGTEGQETVGEETAGDVQEAGDQKEEAPAEDAQEGTAGETAGDQTETEAPEAEAPADEAAGAGEANGQEETPEKIPPQTIETNSIVLMSEDVEFLSVLDNGATTLYVDDDGQKETADGSEEHPYATVMDALDVLKTVKVTEDGKAPNDATKDTIYTIKIMPGTYDRFEVPQHMLNVVIQGVSDENGNKPIIQTFMDDDDLTFGTMDTGGVRVAGAGSITFDNLKFVSGTNKDHVKFFPAVIQDQDGNYGITYPDEPIVIQNCELVGPGKDYNGFYGVGMARRQWTVKDSSFTGFHNAIEMMADNYYVGHVEVTGNIITDCEFGVHGYYGQEIAQDVSTYDNIFVLENNEFTGDSSKNWAMINTLASYSGNNTMKIRVQGNSFESAMMSTLDVLDEYVLDDIKADNAWGEKSYFVEAHYFINTGETSVKWYSTYSGADDENGYTRSQWILSGDTEYGTEEQRQAIQSWLENEDHQWDNPMEVVIPTEDGNGVESFTSAKKFIQRVEQPAGNLTVKKSVNSENETDLTKEFIFQIALSYPTAAEDGIEYDVNGKYYKGFADSAEFTVIKSNGTEQTITNGGKVSIGNGESFTIKNIPEGSKFVVTELDSGKYDVTVDGNVSSVSEGIIAASENITTEFTNTQKITDWDTSKSKTATNLDKNYESQVTLSLPAADVKPSVDVVMVIDISSSMKELDIEEVKSAATVLCDNLAAKTNVETNIGVVTFDRTAHNLTDGLVSIQEAQAAIDSIVASDDTNMVAGLMAGKEMLDAGTSENKYFVVLSDGIPIYWMENGEVTSKVLIGYKQDGETLTGLNRPAGTEPEASLPDWDKFMTMDQIMGAGDWETDSNEWRQITDTGENINPDCRYTNVQKSAYMTAKYLLENIIGQYNVQMVGFGLDKYADNIVYKYGENLCDWIGEQPGVSYYKVSKPNYGGVEGDLSTVFSEIANELVYLLDAGSRVEDYMGYAAGEYDFDFVNSIDKLSLTVGGKKLAAVQIDDNTYGFGEADGSKDGTTYPFTLTYIRGNGTDGEHFVWNINVPVTIEKTVQLTYTVKLMDPKTTAGDYGQYDADGSEGYAGLYTNNSATLYPVDSNGDKGAPETFNKPTVSYTVTAQPTPEEPTVGTAELTITKKVQNTKGNEKKVTATFYASVFTDAAYQNRYGKVIELKLADASETSVTVELETPADGSERTYYVMETDQNGNVVNSGKEFGYQINVKGGQVTVSKSDDTAQTVITNQQVKKGSGSHSSGSDDESTGTSAVSNTQQVGSAKTGDNANIMLYVVLAVIGAAALAACGTIAYKKRKMTK